MGLCPFISHEPVTLCQSGLTIAGSTRSTGASCRRRSRFRRAKGRCEGCGRPHGRVVLHLGDGRWWDDEAHRWRDGAGKWVRRLKPPHSLLERTRTTRVVLATAHRDHDPTNNEASNLAALCQRCHILHDKPEHLRRRRLTYLARRALGDLFTGPYG